MAEVKTRTRTCDQCEADLTHTDQAYHWHYVLEGVFTPSSSCIGYDPHPTPPETSHFCNLECLARWLDNHFGEDVSSEMWTAADKFLDESGLLPSSSYVERRRLGTALFKVMWAARPTRPAP